MPPRQCSILNQTGHIQQVLYEAKVRIKQAIVFNIVADPMGRDQCCRFVVGTWQHMDDTLESHAPAFRPVPGHAQRAMR
ncbi:MAG: hypothetical protein OXQ86_06700 [Gammaproteobacteria bacterium]|nr:hypothetical protein [Gammaproteobacteria bacterium]MDE0413109.1 hypothetical protein [Gammaproteobacteria bacterium]